MPTTILGKASITIYDITDVKKVVTWYKLVSRTSDAPTVSEGATEATMTANGWSSTEPSVDVTKKLYTVVQNVFGDDTYLFNTEVSLSSSYEAAVQAQNNASAAQTTANGKNSVYYQDEAPTGTFKENDIWFDTNDNCHLHKWNGSEWVAFELGATAVADLDASTITTGTLSAIAIEVGRTNNVAGTVTVYDDNNVEVAALDKDGISATAGTIGGWQLNQYGLYSDNVVGVYNRRYLGINSTDQVITSLYNEMDEEDGSVVYSQSAKFNETGLDFGKHDGSSGSALATASFNLNGLYFNNVSFSHWVELSTSRTIYSKLYVRIFRCGNMFWAHFDSTNWKVPSGMSGQNQQKYIPIITGDTDLSESVKYAPPFTIRKYCFTHDYSSLYRLEFNVRHTGELGLQCVQPTSSASSTHDVYMETCDIFWAHIG